MLGRIGLKRLLVRAAVLLLLFAVAGLSTVAKNSRFLPKSYHARYLSKASKMDVVSPITCDRPSLKPAAEFVPPKPTFHVTQWIQPETTPLRQIGLTVSLQHRSPPPSLA